MKIIINLGVKVYQSRQIAGGWENEQATVSEGLAKDPYMYTWRLEWDSNLRLSERKAPNLPLSHQAP